MDVNFRQYPIRRTLLDWLRVPYGIPKPSNKLPTLAELDSNTWVSEVKRSRGKTQPLTAAHPALRFLLTGRNWRLSSSCSAGKMCA